MTALLNETISIRLKEFHKEQSKVLDEVVKDQQQKSISVQSQLSQKTAEL